MAYPLPLDMAYPTFCLIQRIHSKDYHDVSRMTKVIKGEFKKLEDLKGKGVSLTCDISLEQQVSHDADDNMGFDPSDVAFTEWLGSKFVNYKTMDHYTMKALSINGFEEMTKLSLLTKNLLMMKMK
ncbi:hypothetical protein Tco_1228788 [Tanacetum coccineum]